MLIKAEDRTPSSTVDAGEMDDPAKVGGGVDDDDNHGHTSAALLPRCVCSWKNCRAYQKAFRESKHHAFDGIIRIKLLRDHPESRMYKECLDRALGVSKQPGWKENGKDGSEFCKYTIARHHFTEQHILKYDANPKAYSFVKPFSLHGAKKYLYSLNSKETLNVTDDPSEALYMQCPNVPSDIVKSEYYRAMEIIKKGRKNENTTNGGASIKTSSTATNTANNKGGSSTARPSYNKTKYYDDDAKSVGTSASHVEMLKTKEAENKILKDQLDAMKNQLTFLHDMVEKLQAQHFDSASVYSRNSRRSSKSKNSHRRPNASSNSSKQRQYHQKRNEGPASTSGGRGGGGSIIKNANTRAGRYASGTGASVHSGISTANSVPNEINFDDDYIESHTMVSTLNENEYGSEDERTQLTNGTFHSKISKFPTLPPHDDADDSEEDDDDDEETDEHDYTECMSLGTSTILSASRSVKTLPRELELEEDEDDSDTHESLEEEAFDSRSVSSSYHHSPNSSQSFATFGKQVSPIKKRTSVVNNNRSTRRGSMESSIASSTCEGTLEKTGAHLSRNRSAASSTGSSVASSVRSTSLYEVKALEVTDPYGEKGTYSGSISKATGMPHGHGRLEYDEAGRWYEGDWKHGRWTGYGVLANGDGDFYKGGLKNDQKHGQGIMRFADGRTFEGRYFNGQMVQGKMTYQDGSTYEGTWVEGMRHGFGRCIFADNSLYEGEFKEGEFCGRGKMTWNDGGWYEGTWLNGEMHGYGREIRSNGSLRHDGEWLRGQPVRNKN